MPTLLILKGPMKGDEFELRSGINFIGRNAANCDIVLHHDAVSRRHASIEITDQGAFIEDLESHNGTSVNGELLVPGSAGRRELFDTDLVEINGFQLIFYIDGSTTSSVLFVSDELDSSVSIVSSVDVSASVDDSTLEFPTAKLRALLHVIDSLSETIDLREVPQRALASMLGSFEQAHSGFILLRFANDEEFKAAASMHRDGVPRRVRMSRTIINEVVARKSAILTSDATKDLRFADSQSVMRMGLRNMMCAPLLNHQGSVFGLIQLNATNGSSQFNHTDLEVLAGIGRHVATVIENARLHDAAMSAQRLRYERQFRDLVEGSIQGILIHRDFNPLFANEAWARYHGYSTRDILHMESVLPLILPDDAGTLQLHVERLKETDAPSSMVEYRGLCRDGRLVWFQNFMTAIEWDGKPAIQSTIIDVTVRKEAESALKSSEQKYRRLVETSNDLIWSIDAMGRWTFVNNNAAKTIYGYSAGEMVGRNIADFFALEAADQASSFMECMRDAKSFVQVETVHRHKSGRRIVLVFSAIPLRDSQGNVIGTTGTATDITARKRAERELQEAHDELEQRVAQRTADLSETNKRLNTENQERIEAEGRLRRSESLYQSLVETIPAGVARKDLDGRFTFANECYCRALNLQASDICGKTDFDLFPESLASKYRTEDQQAVDAGKAQEFVERIDAPDGTSRYMHTIRSPIRDTDGRIAGVQLIVSDVTLLKQTEQELILYSEELERSNRDLSQFASIVSHDLSAPLRAITSFGQLLDRRYRGKLDATADEFLEHIINGSMRMQTLIENLQAFARVTTRAKPSQPTDVREVIRDAIANLEAEIQESQAVIHFAEMPTVQVDRTQLMQVFQNLIANAIKYRGEQIPKVEITSQYGEREWIFRLQDNGIGIAPSNHERIFIIHQRLHTADEYPGTGLGLALCKRIVERHGGRIWVESELNHGSCFCFTIPTRPHTNSGRRGDARRESDVAASS